MIIMMNDQIQVTGMMKSRSPSLTPGDSAPVPAEPESESLAPGRGTAAGLGQRPRRPSISSGSLGSKSLESPWRVRPSPWRSSDSEV